jgi:HEAT repeat protein
MNRQSLSRVRVALPAAILLTIFHAAPAHGFQSMFAEAFKRQQLGVDSKQWELDFMNLYKTIDLHKLNMDDELPVLIEALDSGQSFIAHRAAALLTTLGTTEFFPEYRHALRAAVPAMEKHLDSPDDPDNLGFWRGKTILFIASVDPNPSARAINGMIRALDDKWTPKVVAIQALTLLKPIPNEVWVMLREKMKTSERIKGLLLERLGANHVSTPEALEVITAALQSGEKDAQILAADTLLKLGTDAKQAMPALRQLAKDPDVDTEVAGKVRLAIQSVEGRKLNEQ